MEDSPNASTTSYSVERARSRKEGLVVSGVAGYGVQSVSICRIHAPIEFEAVYWVASRSGGPPKVPSPDSFKEHPNRAFLGGAQRGTIGFTTGGHDFILAGVYYYVLGTPEGLDASFMMSKCPWEDISDSENYFPAENFITGIVSAFQNQTQGGVIYQDIPILNAPIS